MRVLIVRPEPGNAATAAAVREMGHEPLCVPLFKTGPVAWDAPDPAAFDAVAMTSASAARHGSAGMAAYTHLPLIAVGEATAAAGQAVGFIDVRTGQGDASDLGASFGKAFRHILHFTGTDHRPIPTDARVTAIAVYAARPTALDALPPVDIALVHSPRAAARLADLMPDRATTRIVAISGAAAQAAGPGWAAIHIADVPREHAMLATLARVCEAATKR